jgi:hypothetical protein
MVTKVKYSKPHGCTCASTSIDLSCANSCCSQAKSSCDDHILIETCDNFNASENDELTRENKMLKIVLEFEFLSRFFVNLLLEVLQVIPIT